MRKISVFLSLFAATSLLAQVSQKIDVNVVNVDVTVTNQKGEPVRGLTRNDFLIFEDGKPVELTNFYAVENAPAAAAAPTTVAAAPAAPVEERFRRKVLVLIDNAHITKHGRDTSLAKLEEFINDRFRGGEYDWSIATVGHRVDLLLPPTSDKAAIHTALESIRKDAPQQKQRALDRNDIGAAPTNSFDAGRAMHPSAFKGVSNADPRAAAANAGDETEQTIQARFTVDAIVSAARAFAGAEGKKVVLLLTGDMGINDLTMVKRNEQGDMALRDLGHADIHSNFAENSKTRVTLRDNLIREANASNVSFYVMNAEGLMASEAGDLNSQSNSAVYWIAEQTGGRSMTGNDPALSLRQFDVASSNFYSLGYRPPHGEDGFEHAIDVRLKSGAPYTVHHRAGYSSVPVDAQLGRALQSPMAATMHAASLPVGLTTGAPEASDKGVLVPLSVTLPVGKLQFLPAEKGWKTKMDIYLSVFDASGKNIVLRRFQAGASAETSDPDPTGLFVYKNAVLLKKGESYRIVTAIRDEATDAVGITSREVKF
jgi:VWFA-related protein